VPRSRFKIRNKDRQKEYKVQRKVGKDEVSYGENASWPSDSPVISTLAAQRPRTDCCQAGGSPGKLRWSERESATLSADSWQVVNQIAGCGVVVVVVKSCGPKAARCGAISWAFVLQECSALSAVLGL
jgi:hypothetical protein